MTPCETTLAHLQHWLDQPQVTPFELPSHCIEHLAACAGCSARARGFEALRLAVPACRDNLPDPDGEASRRWIAAASAAARATPRPVLRAKSGRPRWPVLAAAAACAGLGLGFWWLFMGRGGTPAARLADDHSTPTDRTVSEVLLDAGEATASLVRVTSGPAARISRGVLEQAATGRADTPQTQPAAARGWPLVRESMDLRHVGARLGDRVRPLTGRAQEAFGFLTWPRPRPGPGSDGA